MAGTKKMRKTIIQITIKCFFAVCLLAAAFFLSIEIGREEWIRTSRPYPYFDFYDYKIDELLEFDYPKMREILSKYDVDLLVENSVFKDGTEQIYYIGSDEALKEFSEFTGIKEGKYSAVIGEAYAVVFCGWDEITDLPEGYHSELLFVSKYDVRKTIPADVVKSFGAGDFLGKRTDTKAAFEKEMTLTFVIFMLIIVIFDIYELFYEIKQSSIEILLGGGTSGTFLKKILPFNLSTLGAFVGLNFISKEIWNIMVPWSLLGICYTVILVADVVMNIVVPRLNWKKALSEDKESWMLLTFSKMLHIVFLIVFVFLMTSNVSVYHEYKNALKHDDFYTYFKNYGTIWCSDDKDDYCSQFDIGRGKNNADMAYFDLMEAGKKVALISTGFVENSFVINDKALDYVKTQNRSIREIKFEKDKYYVLYPSTKVKEETNKIFDFHWIFDGDIIEMIYSGNVELPMARGAMFVDYFADDDWSKAPILCVDLQSSGVLRPKNMFGPDDEVSFYTHMSFLIELEGTQKVAGKTGRLIGVESLYQQYKESIRPYENAFRSLLTLLCVIGVLMIIVLTRLMKLEFMMSQDVYINRKLMGESFLKRYGRFVLVSAVISIIGVVFTLYVFDDPNVTEFAVKTGLACFVVEVIIQLFLAVKLERESLSKIIKGGIV